MSVPISILLIDDEEELLELYEMKLSSKAHKVTTALTGNQGISKLKAQNFDLILCDINMPDGNGFDVYSYYRENQMKPSFAFITGHAKGSKELSEAERTGAIVFNKPVRFDDIWNLIDKVSLRQPTMPSPSVSANTTSSAPAPTPRERKPAQEDIKMSSSLEQKGMDLIRSIKKK